jgi:hypothetical protein
VTAGYPNTHHHTRIPPAIDTTITLVAHFLAGSAPPPLPDHILNHSSTRCTHPCLPHYRYALTSSSILPGPTTYQRAETPTPTRAPAQQHIYVWVGALSHHTDVHVASCTSRSMQWRLSPIATRAIGSSLSEQWHTTAIGLVRKQSSNVPWVPGVWNRGTTFTTAHRQMKLVTSLCSPGPAFSRILRPLTLSLLCSRYRSSNTAGLTTTFGKLWQSSPSFGTYLRFSPYEQLPKGSRLQLGSTVTHVNTSGWQDSVLSEDQLSSRSTHYPALLKVWRPMTFVQLAESMLNWCSSTTSHLAHLPSHPGCPHPDVHSVIGSCGEHNRTSTYGIAQAQEMTIQSRVTVIDISGSPPDTDSYFLFAQHALIPHLSAVSS